MLLAYSLIVLVIPSVSIQKMFEPQLKSAGISGFALAKDPFVNLLLNNLLVMIVCFVLSLVYGAGAIIFLTWNASVWGVAFSYLSGSDFFRNIPGFLPHMSTEALAYISAAVVGGVVSKAVLREKLFSKKFNHILTDALIILTLGFFLVIAAGLIEILYYSFPA